MGDHETRPWFRKQQIELHLDHEAVRCKSLTKEERTIDSFVYVYLLKLSSRYTPRLHETNVQLLKSDYCIVSGVTVWSSSSKHLMKQSQVP